MSSRPAIPTDIVRKVMIEAGHRCAVCGTPCPLEKAHIVPWSQAKDHSAANLICLCANCHERADREPWDRKTFEEYKRRPWVNRQFGNDFFQPKQRRRLVQVTVDLSKAEYDETEQEWVRHGLASFLDISPKQIEIVSVKEGSTTVTLSLPREAADQLLLAEFQGIQLALQPLRLLKIAPAAVEVGEVDPDRERQDSTRSPLGRAASPSEFWQTVIADLLPRLFQFGLARGLPSDEVRDAVSTVLLELYEKHPAIDAKEELQSLAAKMMRRRILHYYVETRLDRRKAEGVERRQSTTESQRFEALAEEHRSSFVEAIRDLGEPTRSFILDKYFRDLSDEEIAEKYQVSRYTVRHGIRHGRRRLRLVLAGHDDKAREEQTRLNS